MDNTYRMRRIICWFSFLIFLGPCSVSSKQIYLIDGNEMLLYKVINWWYDAVQEEINEPCGSQIRCVVSGEVAVRYAEGRQILTLTVGDSFADQISISGKNVDAVTINHLRLQEAGILADKTISIKFEESLFTNTLSITIQPVTHEQYAEFSGLARGLEVSLDGEIKGLMSGKVALSSSPDLLYNCPVSNDIDSQSQSTAVLKLVDPKSGDTLIRFVFPPLS